MTRPNWICLLLIVSITLVFATSLLAEDQYPDPRPLEDVDPDGLEGISAPGDNQTGTEQISRGNTGNSRAGKLTQIRTIFRVMWAFGL